MALSGETAASDNIRLTLNGKTVKLVRFWNSKDWYDRGYLDFEDRVEDELVLHRGISSPHLYEFLEMALEDWRTYWRRAGSIMRNFRSAWVEELGYELARDEFATRVRQKVEAMRGQGDPEVEAIVDFALQEYDEVEKAKDQEMLDGRRFH